MKSTVAVHRRCGSVQAGIAIIEEARLEMSFEVWVRTQLSGGLCRMIKQNKQKYEDGEGHQEKMGLTREKIILYEP